MRNRFKNLAERGTLMVEAIAMLGLIAMVTPTLYKKSAERMQEIQDINAASQARIMNKVIETFMEANFTSLMNETSSLTNRTIRLAYDDSTTAGSGIQYYDKGYSAYVPFGYNLGDIKNFAEPEIYVHSDGSSLVSFIIFPNTVDPGKKRIARLAALVGANGGVIAPSFTDGSANIMMGTGHAWGLDSSQLTQVNLKSVTEAVPENSLVVTSSEPVTSVNAESDKFLYRGPSENAGEYYRNTMVTDLFMGGLAEPTGWQNRGGPNYYSIYNIRKLTLNTECSPDTLSSSEASINCNPNIADLYIGKPSGTLNVSEYNTGLTGNSGAAWIYGNLSALNSSFKLSHEGGADAVDRASGYDILQFARMNEVGEEADGSVAYEVIRAENTAGSSSVRMLNGFLQVREDSTSASPEFIVGATDTNGGEGAFIRAYTSGGRNEIYINSPDNSSLTIGNTPITHINRRGGIVYINSGSSSVDKETYINENGGKLSMGSSAAWLSASHEGGSAEVYILGGQDLTGEEDNRKFMIGATDTTQNYMMYGDSQKVSLRGGQVRVFSPGNTIPDNMSTKVGGSQMVQTIGGGETISLDGATAVLSKYTDILGSTYLGINAMSSAADSSSYTYSRGEYVLGVAGNAWIDKFLRAERAWFESSGVKEFHAGFNNAAQFHTSPRTGWFNVYDDQVIIRDPSVARLSSESSQAAFKEDDVMFLVNQTHALMRDHYSAIVEVENGQAYIGNKRYGNRFYVDSSSANMAASSLVNIYTEGRDTDKVNIQKGAMIFSGRAEESSGTSYLNTIEAQAKEFSIKTQNAGSGSDSVQFYADSDQIRMRYVNFNVEDNNSSAVFEVRPNATNSDGSDVQVQVHGSFLVNGNDVIHIGSNSGNEAHGSGDEINRHATFEVESSYVQVMAKSGGNLIELTDAEGHSTDQYLPLLTVNAEDISGNQVAATPASVYIRRGAIELEQNTQPTEGATVTTAADTGYGYIKASRLVSNASETPKTSTPTRELGGGGGGSDYDQYMVNPAYTSVMHDIKLTTRGGARLSDILPDYVLKGVYNLVNNCKEGTTSCTEEDMSEKADPFIGIIPYAICPPGYKNLAAVVPTSFQVGQAGQINKSADGRWQVDTATTNAKRANMLRAAASNGIAYPTYEKVEKSIINSIWKPEMGDWSTSSVPYTQGWFLGYNAVHGDTPDDTTLKSGMSSIAGNNQYWDDGADSNRETGVVPEALYFQQNTWLKTSLAPESGKGWNTYIGFLYDSGTFSSLGTAITAPVNKNNNSTGNASSGDTLDGNFYWNVFPVPTNTLEAHATVYCYFDRASFGNDWDNVIDRTPTTNWEHRSSSVELGRSSESGYAKRLNDPSLKYSDPW